MNFKFFLYKNRFLFKYIIIGVISLIIELFIYNIINDLTSNILISSIIGVLTGVFLSFWLNINFNFKISKTKRDRALGFFLLISFSSYLLQLILRSSFQIFHAYELNRILFAASLFWIAYFFHLKLSFKDFKKVGVAIYANGVDDIHSIYMKINNYADLIHIDIIDHTFNSNAANVLSYKSEVIRAYWNNKYIEAHIMSSNPMVWINEIIKYVNRIYIHVNINESIDKVIKLIKENKCECGLVIMKEDDVKYWE